MLVIAHVKVLRIIVLLAAVNIPEISLLSQTSGKEKKQSDSYNSLLFSTDYNSQTNTFGLVNNDVKQPNFNGYLSFYSKYNIDISVQGGLSMNSDTSYSKTTRETDFMAGYTWALTKKLSFYPSYTHLWTDRSANALQRVFKDIFQLDVYYDTKYYQPALTLSYLSGTKNMFYFSLQNAFNLDIDNILGRNTILSLGLSLDLNFSDKNFYNSMVYDQWKAGDFVYWTRYYTTYPKRPAAQILLYGLEETKNDVYNWVTSNGPKVFDPVYTLTSVDVMLPVFYSFNNFMLSATAFLVVPATQSDFYGQSAQLILNFGIAYSLNFIPVK